MYIPNSVKEIGDHSFFGNANVKGKIYFPEGLISIGIQSFSQCGISGEVNIPSSVTSIKNSFFNAEYITKINVDSNNLNYSSQDGILYNKDKTELIIAPKGLTINNLTLPDSLKVIDSFAFCDCKASGIVIIPESVTNVGSDAFYGCNKLEAIKCRVSSKPDGWDNDWNNYCNANVEWGYTGD